MVRQPAFRRTLPAHFATRWNREALALSEFCRNFGRSISGRRGYTPRMKKCTALAFLAIAMALPRADAQTAAANLEFHAASLADPANNLELAALAGAMQAAGSPREWRQGARSYGERFASLAAENGIRHLLAFGAE